MVEVEDNDTLDFAHDLGTVSASRAGEAIGSIGNSVTQGADVDWYSFTLTQASSVHLAAFGRTVGSTFSTVLGLYQQTTDVFDFHAPYGYRLVAQADGAVTNRLASLDQSLAPGTYWVAVSGSGNRYFNPRLANSGTEGVRGEYGLQITANEIAQQPGDGPVVIAAQPAAGSALSQSPFTLRLVTNSALDVNTLLPDVTLFLTYNPTGNFGDGNDQPVLVQATFSALVNELQLLPLSPFTFGPIPLAPGFYRLTLAGDLNTNAQTIFDVNGVTLGADANNPSGRDFVTTFRIVGSEGRTSGVPDDSPATARELGNVTNAGLIQVRGAIGDDSAYNPANADPLLTNPASDVDHYHFRITGSGRYAVIAEVSSGRIGSGLDSAVSLYRVDPFYRTLSLVASNDNSLNTTQASDFSSPLFGDAVAFAGLSEGEYYVVVSGATNVPDRTFGIEPGSNGVYDPHLSHSGLNGYSVGDYVLNLFVQADNEAPRVTAATAVRGSSPLASPTRFTVRFNEAVNLPTLANLPALNNTPGGVDAVFVRGPDGNNYYPRLLSYDSSTNVAEFLMLDRLPNGVNELRLSGAAGLTDLAGNWVASNNSATPFGDFVLSFTVNGVVPGSPGNPNLWFNEADNDSLAEAQPLGLLFPRELQGAVTLRRSLSATADDTADYYQIELIQSRTYLFGLSNTAGLPTGTVPEVIDSTGRVLFTLGRTIRQINLTPGTYFLRVQGWTAEQAPDVKYDLRITLGTSQENPTPLTAGPAPAFRLTLRLSDTPGAANPGGGNTGGNPSGGSTASPRLALGDSNPTFGLGVVPAFLASDRSSALGGGEIRVSASLLSEGPVGGVRANSANDGGAARVRLTLPKSGGSGDAEESILAIADDAVPDPEEDAPAPVADRVFAAVTQLVDHFRRHGVSQAQDHRHLADWFSRWMAAVSGTGIRPLSAMQESEKVDEEVPDDEEFVSDEEATANLTWALGLLVASVGAIRPVEPTRSTTKRENA